MDWENLISRCGSLTQEQVPFFAPPREMEQAVNFYNKALLNLAHDSQDIAMITLRKLAATFPLFAQPAFVLGCCLALDGKLEEAQSWIDQAVLAGLPDDLQDLALTGLSELHILSRQPAMPRAGVGESGDDDEVRLAQSAQILEKVQKRGKVRLASDKERREVIRRGEFPQAEETHVAMDREPVEFLRIALPVVAALLVLTVLIIAGMRWLPQTGLFQWRERRAAVERLDWLVSRLEQMAADDPAAAAVLADFQSRFYPTPVATAEPTAVPTPDASTLPTTPSATPTQTPGPTAMPTQAPSATPDPTPSLSPVPTPDPAVIALQTAADHYRQAEAIKARDLLACADYLLQARALLHTLPPALTAEGVSGSAGDLAIQVETMISEIAVTAANRLRLLAETEFKAARYEQALVYYLPAYQLNPRSYGGGVAYYLGRCYQLLGDPEAAKPYYEYVVATFAGRDIAVSAAFRLREMGYQ